MLRSFGLWPQRDQFILDYSDSQSQGLPELAKLFFFPPLPSPHPYLPVGVQASLTGNTFLCNLPWQGENISIKGLRQTSLVLDNLSE